MSFEINLHSKDISILYSIKDLFGVGSVTTRADKNLSVYRVTKLDDLVGVIIPRGAARPLAKAASRCLQPGLPPAHCTEYQLMTKKRADFILFNSIIDKIIKKEHLTMVGFC